MGNFWKKMCVCSLALVSPFAMFGCGDNEASVPVDLDGDGTVSSWENFFEAENPSTRSDGVDVVSIRNVDDLLAINSSEEADKKYILARDIDCGGRELCVNLKTSTLYGNNKTITNFKLGKHNIVADNDPNRVIAVNECAFINGAGIYDLNIFLGKQDVSLENTASKNLVAPIVDCNKVDNVSVRGYLNVQRKKVDGLVHNELQVSMLGANYDMSKIMDIRNVDVLGKIDCFEDSDSLSSTSLGSVMSKVNTLSTLYNATSQVDITVQGANTSSVGMIAGENYGMLTTCTSSGQLNVNYISSANSVATGGIVGAMYKLSETRNVSTNATMNVNYVNYINSSRINYAYVGGIVGHCDGGIVEYATSDCNITANENKIITIAGICGVSIDSVFSNTISRGNIVCNKTSNQLNISNVIGVSRNGLIEKSVVTTNITANCLESNTNINTGLVTIFEDYIACMPNDTYATATQEVGKYSASYSPNFNGILISGNTQINMRAQSSNSNAFTYNLGLRNDYKYDTGEFKDVEIEDEENGGTTTIQVPIFKTYLPKVFSNIYYITDGGYSIKKMESSTNGAVEATLEMTYPSNENNQSLVFGKSKSINADWLGRYIGFKYGLNNSDLEMNTTPQEPTVDLNKIKFNISKDKHLIGRFEKVYYNNELSSFDHQILSLCSFNTQDELFSLLNNAIVSKKGFQHIQLILGDDFLNSVHPDDMPDISEDEDIEEGEEEELNYTPNSQIIRNELREGLEGEGQEGEGSEEDIPEDIDYELLEADATYVSSQMLNLKNNIIRLFGLMNLKPEGYNWQDERENNLMDFQMPKWLEILFSDAHYSYKLVINLRPLTDKINGEVLTGDRMIVDMYMTTTSHS